MRTVAPEWTDGVRSDPGITLLELFAFLTENLTYRRSPLPPGGVAAARRLSEAARALAGADPAPKRCRLERVGYFTGQILGTDDFADEQNYFRTRLRRLNLYVLGAGVVSGLRVTLAPENGPASRKVVVGPGFALDPRGEEIEVCEETSLPLPPQGRNLYVQLLFVERPTSPVPSPEPAGGSPGDGQAFSRIEETFAVVLSAARGPDAVAIARLAFRRGRWQVDRGFKPARI